MVCVKVVFSWTDKFVDRMLYSIHIHIVINIRLSLNFMLLALFTKSRKSVVTNKNESYVIVLSANLNNISVT